MNGPISPQTRCLKGGREVVKGQRLAHRPPAEKMVSLNAINEVGYSQKPRLQARLRHYSVSSYNSDPKYIFATFVSGYSCDSWPRAKRQQENLIYFPLSPPHMNQTPAVKVPSFILSPCPAAGRQILCYASSSCPSPGRSSADWTRPTTQKDTERQTC